MDSDVMRAVRIKAARSGKGDSEVIEEAVRKHLGLDVLDRIWEHADMDDDEAMELALKAQRWARRSKD